MISNKLKDFALQCLSLSSSEARVVVFGIGLVVLSNLDLTKTGLPPFCLWEWLIGYCPSDGTIRALNALLRGDLFLALEYNINVLFTAPIIVCILLKDLIEMFRSTAIYKKIKKWVLKRYYKINKN